jgi:hypothetical protein
MGKARSKEPEFLERQTAAANAKKALLERFRANAADPATATAQEKRVAEAAERTAARKVREAEKAERKAREAEAAAAAKREAAAQAEHAAAEMAERKRAAETQAKADRDARYAARKAKAGKRKR